MYVSILGDLARWSARTLGLLFFAFMSFFVVAHVMSPEGLPPLWRSPLGVQLDSLALFLMVIGGVVGWKSPSVASVMILFGYGLWQCVERRLPWPPSLIEIPLVIGLLYAVTWWCTKRPITLRRNAMQSSFLERTDS